MHWKASISIISLLISICWFDPGWVPGVHQSCSVITLLSPDGKGRENKTKDLWVEISAGRDHSLVTVTGKTGSARAREGNNLSPIKSE